MSNRPPRHYLVGGASVASILWVLTAIILGAALVVTGLVLLSLRGMAL